MFLIDITSKIPIFEQLKKQILEFISVGILNPDDQLPSVRNLAYDLGINPNTVSKAYQELESQGYIYTLKGRGCFVGKNNNQIITNKLDEFKVSVKEMKLHQIDSTSLKSIIDDIYGEGNK